MGNSMKPRLRIWDGGYPHRFFVSVRLSRCQDNAMPHYREFVYEFVEDRAAAYKVAWEWIISNIIASDAAQGVEGE